jgi:DNA repair photolyase
VQVYIASLQQGITRTREFERKRLAAFAVNVGTKCGHGCTYCGSGALLRMHASFKQVGRSPFESGYAVVDPETPTRVARDARRLRHRGLVQLCTTVDAWSPEAQEHKLGRRCLEALLAEPGWMVRILTKNAAVARDFDLIEQYRDRVTVGLSVTATPDNAAAISVLEPYASPITERIAAMREAHRRGLRTYAMLCPLLPGIATTPAQIDELVSLGADCGAEEIFVEPVNARGPGLKLTQHALAENGYEAAATELSRIRAARAWSEYVVGLIADVQRSVRARSDVAKLRILLYPSKLTPEDLATIQQDDAGVIWLGKRESRRHADQPRLPVTPAAHP